MFGKGKSANISTAFFLRLVRLGVLMCQAGIGKRDKKHHIHAITQRTEALMQSNNRLFDDMSKIMTNAMGVAQGAKDEAETAMKSWIDRWMADREFVSREEFDAVKAMAQKAREENANLLARIEALETAKKPKAKK